MLRILTFRSDGAFWPLSQRSDFEAGAKASGLTAKLTAFAKRFKTERAAQRAAEELASLDDRTLKDIGISREQIRHVVRYGRDAVHGQAFDIARWS